MRMRVLLVVVALLLMPGSVQAQAVRRATPSQAEETVFRTFFRDIDLSADNAAQARRVIHEEMTVQLALDRTDPDL